MSICAPCLPILTPPHVGDIGYPITHRWILQATGAAISVAGATLIEYQFYRPDGTVPAVIAGALATDGLDGAVKALSTAGLFNQAGEYRVQVRTVAPLLGDRRSDIYPFPVRPNLV